MYVRFGCWDPHQWCHLNPFDSRSFKKSVQTWNHRHQLLTELRNQGHIEVEEEVLGAKAQRGLQMQMMEKKWKEDWSQANSWKWAVHLAGAHLEAESGWSLFLRILNFMPVSSRFKEGLFPSFQSFDGAVFQSVHVKWNSRQEKQHRYRWVSCLCESNCNKADCHASWDSMPPLSSLFPSWKGVASVSEVLLPGWVWLILQQPTSSLQFPTASTLCGAAVMFELGKDQGAHKADSQATYIYNFSTWYVDNFRMVAIWVPPKLATWP